MSENLLRDQNRITVAGGQSSTDSTVVLPIKIDPTTGRVLMDSAGGGTGTVTSVSVVSANGLAGTVATATTTPAITLSTTITGILSGNGTAISAATATGSGSVVLATSPTLITPALGTPTAIVLTSATGLPLTTGVTGTLPATNGGTGQSTYAKGDLLASPGSNTLNKLTVGSDGLVLTADAASTNGVKWAAGGAAASITVGTTTVGSGTNTRVLFDNSGVLGEYVISGTGNVAMTTSPSFTTPVLGTPTSGTLTNCTGYTIANLSGAGTGVLTALGVNVGSAGAFVTFNGALGTPSSGTLTNATGLPIAGLVASTSTAIGVGSIELGAASDTTIARSGAGAITVEGVQVILSGAALGTPSSGTLTNCTGLPAASIVPGTLATGAYVLAENASVQLDPAGSADGKFTGITMTATGGATIAFGNLLYLDAATSRWKLTDADAAATGGPVMVAIAVSTSTDGTPVTLLLQGNIRADTAFPTLTIGAPVYLGETAGAIQTAIPTGADNVIKVVGFALTADEIYFNPSPDWQITVA